MEKNFEIRSKLLDGLLAPVFLILITILVVLLIRPVEILFQRPGLLVYTVILLAGAVVSLERSVVLRFPDAARALWGTVGGLLTWAVIELSNLIGNQGAINQTAILLLMLVGLIVGVLWKKVLPLGVKFYTVTFLGGWIGHLGVQGIQFVLKLSSDPSANGTYQMIGFSLIGLCVIIMGWIFLQSKSRIQRLWGTVALWLCAILLIYIFRGGLV
jgi:hypothetical protein